MLYRGLWLATFVFIALPAFTSAQTFISTDPFTVSVTPKNPVPNGQVVLQPISGSLSLSNAQMTVSIGKKEIYQGNAQTISVPLGGGGQLTTIDIVMTSNGKTYPKTISIRPQEVLLIAEPLSTAPAFYPGKPLVPLEGSVRIVAMANLKNSSGVSLDQSKLSYAWVVDSTRIAGSSGIGKNTIFVASPLQYRARDVSVTVQSQDGTLVGGASLNLDPKEPTVRLYESDPLLGILYDQVIASSFNIASNEKTLFAAPYSFPTKSGAPTLRWFLNGTSAQAGSTITLRPTGSGTGNASLSLTVSAGESTTATNKLSVSFGAAPSGFGSIFGL